MNCQLSSLDWLGSNPTSCDSILFLLSYSVSVDGLTGGFMVTEVPVTDIRVENLEISPAQATIGDLVTISVTVKNYGNIAGTKRITCTVT